MLHSILGHLLARACRGRGILTPRHTTPYYTTPRHTTPHHTKLPVHTSPHHTTPRRFTPLPLQINSHAAHHPCGSTVTPHTTPADQQSRHTTPADQQSRHTPPLQINSHALNTLGPQVEVVSGSLRFGVLYVAGALGGGLASTLKNPGPSIGASGGWGACGVASGTSNCTMCVCVCVRARMCVRACVCVRTPGPCITAPVLCVRYVCVMWLTICICVTL